MASPFLALRRLFDDRIRILASAFAVTVYRRWTFISSPSKSPLKGLQTHSLNLSVLSLCIKARKPIIDYLCKEGYLLKSTTSSFIRCLWTMSFNFKRYAIFYLTSSVFKKYLFDSTKASFLKFLFILSLS